jgi:hypothetical protein
MTASGTVNAADPYHHRPLDSPVVLAQTTFFA